MVRVGGAVLMLAFSVAEIGCGDSRSRELPDSSGSRGGTAGVTAGSGGQAGNSAPGGSAGHDDRAISADLLSACTRKCDSYVPSCLTAAEVPDCIARCTSSPFHARFPGCKAESLALLACESNQVDLTVLCTCAAGTCYLHACYQAFVALAECVGQLPPVCSTSYSELSFSSCSVDVQCIEGHDSFQARCWHPADPGPWQCSCDRSDGFTATSSPVDSDGKTACDAAVMACDRMD